MSPSRLDSPPRILLLAPPSLSSHPSALSAALTAYSPAAADMEMLDRVAAGHASLETGAYDTVVLLSEPQAQATLGRAVMAAVADALAPEGRVVAQEGELARADRTEGILAGLLVDNDGSLVKPKPHDMVVLLKSGSRRSANLGDLSGVGFVDFGDGQEIITGEDDDDELVDEDELLTEEDRTLGLMQRRRWCFMHCVLD
jgi:anamorsin